MSLHCASESIVLDSNLDGVDRDDVNIDRRVWDNRICSRVIGSAIMLGDLVSIIYLLQGRREVELGVAVANVINSQPFTEMIFF